MTSSAHGVTLREAVRVWAYVGLNSFGGPAGQIAVMHRELVERRRWLSERRFLHALNYCMILPGPEAQQLATYVGWLMHGRIGAVVAGGLFVVPGFIAMLALSVAFVLFGDIVWVDGLLFGLQAAVVALVVDAVIRIGRRTLRTRALQILALTSFVAVSLLRLPFPVVIAAAALSGWLIGRRQPRWVSAAEHRPADPDQQPALLPDDESIPPAAARAALRAAAWCAVLWLLPVAALIVALGVDHVLAQEAILFSKSAVLTFGGAYAVLGYIAAEAVNRYGWISPQDMVTGLGLAETTPGPLIMVVQFVGFLAAYNSPGSLSPLLAGTLGAVVAVWVTFVPCFLFIFLGAPYVERLRHNQSLSHALTAVGAAVAGVVLNLAVWFSLHTLFSAVDEIQVGPVTLQVPEPASLQLPALAIAVLAAILLLRYRMATLKVLALSAFMGALLAVAIR
jgi:chromate transporter